MAITVEVSRLVLTDPNSVRVDSGGRSVGLFCKTLPARVDRALIEDLKAMTVKYSEKNLRLCLHSGPEALFHSMIILERKGTYYAPHRHRNKGECWHIIEGSLGAFAFDEYGLLIDAQRLDNTGTIIYRVELGMYHTVSALSDIVIYHESKLGPFLGNGDSLVAPWAPDGSDSAEAALYLESLVSALPPQEE